MRYLIIVAFLFSLNAQAQTLLKFDKRNAQCEDQWVAYQKTEKDTAYLFGYIYIDSQAGLTFNYEGTFKIDAAGRYIPARVLDNSTMKVRLEPHKGVIAIIPEEKFAELGVKAVPEWLAIYKTGENTIERLQRWGYFYNAYDMSGKALTYLEKAYQLNPKFAGVEFELGYAYNALGQFNKAVEVLTDAIATSPKECYLYKELSYANIHLQKIDEASKIALKGIEVCDEKPIKAEIAFNIAGDYFNKKDLTNFTAWAKETRKWTTKDDQFSKYLDDMESKLKK
ncbi:tetratricopeptide repeat protein [Pedobacter sp. PWIIR3]